MKSLACKAMRTGDIIAKVAPPKADSGRSPAVVVAKNLLCMKACRFSSDWLAVVLIALALLVGPRRALAARAIGLDVSDYQSRNIHWGTLKNTYGISFA